MPPQPDRMVSRPIPPRAPMAGLPNEVVTTPIDASIQKPGSGQPFKIQIMAPDGHLLVELTEQNGMLVARGDESRWDEGAKRFLYGMLQWSGQVGIRWKDEAIQAGEE